MGFLNKKKVNDHYLIDAALCGAVDTLRTNVSFSGVGREVASIAVADVLPDDNKYKMTRGFVMSNKTEEVTTSAAKHNTENKMPDPGTEMFAKVCRNLDRRPLPYRFLKRLFDIMFSACVIVIGFAPCLLLSLAIIADTKGSPIYSQIRVGRCGRPFRVWKFRSMVADSDDVEKYLTLEQLNQWKEERKVDDDPRVTRVGRVIRKLSIDELPNFLNVFCGQLSVIGPRAITYDELRHYGPRAVELLSVPQGITGLWQIGDRNSASFENGTRQAIELGYVEQASLKTDLAVFFGTFGAMFVRRTGR